MTVKLNNELEMRCLYLAASIVQMINPETVFERSFVILFEQKLFTSTPFLFLSFLPNNQYYAFKFLMNFGEMAFFLIIFQDVLLQKMTFLV